MAGIIEYKCPCCGGKIEFESSLQQLKCPYCDTTFDVSALLEKDEALNNQPADDMSWEHPHNAWGQDETDNMDVYSCQSCGGEIIVDSNTGATHCPFCGNPVVFAAKFSGQLKPDYVLPFQLDKEQAKAALKRHMSGKKLLPKLFSEENHLDEIKGVYVPFWLFGADVDAQMNFHGTRARMWRTANREFTETSHFRLERMGSMSFEHVPVDGSTQMADDMMESLEPFDYSLIKPFQTAYLSGYFADKYDVSAEQSMPRANERIKKSTEQAISATTGGYAAVVTEGSSVQFHNAKAKYALYPVWLLNTTYQGQKYQFAMNGQSGKFIGDMPIGKKEYWIWKLIWTAILSGASWLGIFLFFLR